MSVKAVFEKVRDALDDVGIPYFVSGSFASSAHGVPRSTNDIDVVIAPSRAQLRALLERFPAADFAKDQDDALDALARQSSFQVIDYATMWKIDFLLKQSNEFDQARFERRGIVEIAGVPLYAASAEDILLTKLWWAKLGESERQIRDAAGILTVQRESLDMTYIDDWVARLELEHQWVSARQLAG